MDHPYREIQDRDREQWTKKEDALLGTDTDREIATKLKRSSISVGSRRLKLGIQPFKKRDNKT